jgi:hypothetical protein
MTLEKIGSSPLGIKAFAELIVVIKPSIRSARHRKARLQPTIDAHI